MKKNKLEKAETKEDSVLFFEEEEVTLDDLEKISMVCAGGRRS